MTDLKKHVETFPAEKWLSRGKLDKAIKGNLSLIKPELDSRSNVNMLPLKSLALEIRESHED